MRPWPWGPMGKKQVPYGHGPSRDNWTRMRGTGPSTINLWLGKNLDLIAVSVLEAKKRAEVRVALPADRRLNNGIGGVGFCACQSDSRRATAAAGASYLLAVKKKNGLHMKNSFYSVSFQVPGADGGATAVTFKKHTERVVVGQNHLKLSADS